jgi:GGDEF domain-containing protein
MSEIPEQPTPLQQPAVESNEPLYGSQIKPYLPAIMRRLSNEQGANQEALQDIMKPLQRYVIDPGFAREARYQDRVVPPVFMLNRSAMLAHIEELRDGVDAADLASAATEGSAIHFSLLDVANLRSINNAGAGDYVLNSVAQNLLNQVEQINNELREKKGGELVVGRYGGDEYVVGYYGITDEEFAQYDARLKNAQVGVQSVDAYYAQKPQNEGGIVTEDTVKLKPEPSITVPTEQQQAAIFWEFFHKGIILHDEEIKRELHERELWPVTQIETEAQELTVDQRLVRLFERHPEMRELMNKVSGYLGENIEDPTLRDDYNAEFISYIEGIVYDRLLGEKVRPFDDLFYHLEVGDVADLRVYDFKGLKELNDHVSLVQGDRAIEATFNSISNIIRAPQTSDRPAEYDETKHVMYFRRGGTIVVATRTNDLDGLSSQKAYELDSLQSVTLPIGQDQTTQFELGRGYMRVDAPSQLKDQPAAVAGIVSTLLQEVDTKWYKSVASHILNSHSEQVLAGQVGGEKPTLQTINEGDNLLTYFFAGKRRVEHLSALARVVDNMKTYALPDAEARFDSLLREIHRNIGE